MRGYRVVLTAHNAAELARAADPLRAQHGDRGDWIAADLSTPAQAQMLVPNVEQRFGALDALTNNARVGACKPMVDWTPQEAIDCMNLNLLAPMLLLQAGMPGMVSRRRCIIVDIAPDLARRPLANMAPYAATKCGLLGFSGSRPREAKAHGVTVGTVLPGIIDSAFNGAQEGSSKDAAWALRAKVLAAQVIALLALPKYVLIDELTILPLHQDF